MDLTVNLAPRHKIELRLRNPIMTASGTFSNGIEMSRHYDVEALGAIVSKGTTLRPRRGNDTPRTVETAAGMINSIGFQNIGIGALVREVAPIWARWSVPAIVNIMGETLQEYGQLAQRLEGVPGVAGIEVNVSCPNVEAGGMEFGQDPRQAAAVVREVAAHTSLPQIVKLTPNVADIRPIAEAVQAAGAQAVTISNTIPAIAIDVKRRQPVLGRIFGGLSGPAVKPVTLRNVYQAAGVIDIPITASGGAMTGIDVVEFIMAGATAVQIGTATFLDPAAPWRILEEFTAWCEAEGVSSVEEIRGVARRRD
ncbi:MAG: dihydroorotate dehydrogenase [Chloroflexi bacterium]|nr:dihydroorotate dehydrogenase [Chloroflexota bacterium]MQC25781.1 dihydroorotate dehydrogenase [Chloroflexota bacterium]